MKKIPAKTRKAIHKEVFALTKTFHNNIPLDVVDDILRRHGYLLLQEDNTPWSGFLCGRDANTVFTLGTLETVNEGQYTPIETGLYFSWYKHTTGRYEINAYLS